MKEVDKLDEEEGENDEVDDMFTAPTPVARPRAKSELKFLDEEDPADSIFGAENAAAITSIGGADDENEYVFAPSNPKKKAQTIISIFGNDDDDDVVGEKSMFD